MRKIAVWAVLVVCGGLLLSGVLAQRMMSASDEGATGTSPVPVAVANFPASQAVTGAVDVRNFPLTVNVQGAVDVTNFPATQAVTGTVNIGNFPEPAQITVNIVTPRIRFAGFTVATLPPTGDPTDPGFGYAPQVLDLNRACHAEFPGSRACILEEIGLLTPPPESWPDRAWDLEHGVGPTNPNVILLWAGCRYANGSYTTLCGGGASPVACCTF